MDTQYQKIKSITLRQLVYALAAADQGSVTAASQRLNVSQPAISAAIAALEDHYGLKLFTRLPAQGVVLTPFGTRVMAEARLMCDQALTVSSLAAPDAKITGEIGLCCYEAIAPYILPRLLKRLRERLPEVTVRFFEADLEGTVSALKQGRADLAITYDLGLDDDVGTQTLYTLQPHVICATGHRFAKRDRLALAELDGEDLILLDQPLSAQYVVGLLNASGAEPVVVAQVRGTELQRSLVSNGFGVALVYTVPATTAAYDGSPVRKIRIKDDIVEQRVLLAHNRRNESRPTLKAVQAEMIDEFAGAMSGQSS